MSRRVLLGLAAVGHSALVAAQAEVIGIEVLERSSFASGMNFGDSGAYEKIRAMARY